MKSFITLFAFLSIAFPIVHAHGFLSSVTINGQTFQGNAPGRSARSSPIRQTNSQNPIKGAKNQAVNCGPGAKLASQTVTARAGSSISFKWSAADGSRWPHNTGPMLVYAAKCSGPCNKFNSANARWFKVDQVGKEGNQWAQQRLMNGGSHNSKIPDNLAPGEYLFKHEIIALHLANQQGGAEFYEGCVQVKVTGSGTGAPSNNELVSLPGAYSDNQKGILFNAFGNEKYPFPGPAISKLSSRASGRSLAAEETEEEETYVEEPLEEEQPEEEEESTVTAEEEEEESTEEEQPEEETSEESETTTEHYPRVISRVMRGIHH